MNAAHLDDGDEGAQLIEVHLHDAKTASKMRSQMHWTYQAARWLFLPKAHVGQTKEGSLTNNPLAAALALLSTFGFGAGFVLTQLALRWMPPQLGAAFSIPTSTLMFWCLAPLSIAPADVDLGAAALFAGVGLLFPAAVTLLNFEANRLLGPNVASAVGGLAPIFAVLLAAMLLGERLRALQLSGLAAIVGGVGLMYQGQWRIFTPRGVWPGLWLLALPLGSAGIRGFVQPVIKLGLERWHNPIAAVVIGYTVSSAVLILTALLCGRGLERRFDCRGALWFAGVGLCNGSAVLLMYAALGRGPVALVSPLIATYPLVTLLLSLTFLKRAAVDTRLIVAVAMTVGGGVLLLAT
jgi:drug/metabolite transporter (DMT)-like permease